MTETKILWCKNYSEIIIIIIIIQLELTGTETCMCAHERDSVRFKWVSDERKELGEKSESQHNHMVTTEVKVTCRTVVCSYTPSERRISLSNRLETEQIFLIITVIIKKKEVGATPTCFHINNAVNSLTDASVSMNSREKERDRKTLLAEDVLFIVQQAAFRKSKCSPWNQESTALYPSHIQVCKIRSMEIFMKLMQVKQKPVPF